MRHVRHARPAVLRCLLLCLPLHLRGAKLPASRSSRSLLSVCLCKPGAQLNILPPLRTQSSAAHFPSRVPTRGVSGVRRRSAARRSPLSPASNRTLPAVGAVLAASAAVFPDQFVHLGGGKAFSQAFLRSGPHTWGGFCSSGILRPVSRLTRTIVWLHNDQTRPTHLAGTPTLPWWRGGTHRPTRCGAERHPPARKICERRRGLDANLSLKKQSTNIVLPKNSAAVKIQDSTPQQCRTPQAPLFLSHQDSSPLTAAAVRGAQVLRNAADIFGWFVRKVQGLAGAVGRTPVHWEEVFDRLTALGQVAPTTGPLSPAPAPAPPPPPAPSPSPSAPPPSPSACSFSFGTGCWAAVLRHLLLPFPPPPPLVSDIDRGNLIHNPPSSSGAGSSS